MESVRVDQWLWGVRIYKTRSAATDACRGGHVRVNGSPAKPATPLRLGHQVEAQVNGRLRRLEVIRLVDKRVGAPAAADCFVDDSPPVHKEERALVLRRDPGAGRPTKRERRQLDRARSR